MNYTKKEKMEIQSVFDAFKEYIEPNPAMETMWSDKLGFILIRTEPVAGHLNVDAEIITSAENLCQKLVGEIGLDVFEISGRDHGLGDASKLDHDEIVRRVTPYLNQLPQYSRYLEKWIQEI